MFSTRGGSEATFFFKVRGSCARVFTEVGKNINQDKILSLKRYVQGYHEHVKSLNSPPDSESHRHEGKRSGKRRGNFSQRLKESH